MGLLDNIKKNLELDNEETKQAVKDIKKSAKEIKEQFKAIGKIGADQISSHTNSDKVSGFLNGVVPGKNNQGSSSSSSNSTSSKEVKKEKEMAGLSPFKIAIVIVGILVFVTAIGSCSSCDSSEQKIPITNNQDWETPKEEVIPEEDLFAVKIDVDFQSNLLFSTYDISVYVDDETLGVLDHGTDGSFELELAEGMHVLRVEKIDDSTVDGRLEFSVSEDTTLRCKVSCNSSQVHIEMINPVNPPLSSDEVKAKQKEEIEKAFQNAGFKNIALVEERDLSLEDKEKASTVKEVVINGKTSYSKEDVFYPEDEVEIVYHLLGDIAMPASSTDFEKKPYRDVVKQLETAGFSNIQTKENNIHEDGYGEYSVVHITAGDYFDHIFGSGSFEKGDKFPFDTEIRIVFNPEEVLSSGTADEEPDSWDREYSARQTFERYGKRLYPYGFKCHWYMDLVTSEEQSDGSWFFKVGATIENAYGNEVRTYAQGTVKGSKVTDWYVSG